MVTATYAEADATDKAAIITAFESLTPRGTAGYTEPVVAFVVGHKVVFLKYPTGFI